MRRSTRPRRPSPARRSSGFSIDLEGRCAALASGTGMDLAGGRLRRLRSRHQRPVDPQPHHAASRSSSSVRRSNSRPTAMRPIAANLGFTAGRWPADLQAVFDWRQTGPQTWDIEVETVAGLHPAARRRRSAPRNRRPGRGGGAVGRIPGHLRALRRASARRRRRKCDDMPFRLVADAFMIGKRVQVEAFES